MIGSIVQLVLAALCFVAGVAFGNLSGMDSILLTIGSFICFAVLFAGACITSEIQLMRKRLIASNEETSNDAVRQSIENVQWLGVQITRNSAVEMDPVIVGELEMPAAGSDSYCTDHCGQHNQPAPANHATREALGESIDGLK